jgi:hypothetical protein
LGLKITATVSWFESQNQKDYGLSVVRQNRREDEDGVEHVLRSSGLLRLEASRVRVSQSGLKIGGGVVWIVHVTSSWMLHRVKAKDGRVDVTRCIRLFYSNFIISVVLDPRGILVFFYLLVGCINMTQGVRGSLSPL